MPRTKTKKAPKAPKSPKATPTVAPIVDLGGDWGSPLVPWGSGSIAGVRVNEYTILKIATVLACVRYIATTIATTDYNVYENLPNGGKEYRPDHDVDWILDKEANPETPSIVFWETMLLWALIWGNAYAEIERDGFDRVRWLWQISPDRVEMDRRNGQQVYVVRNDAGTPDTVLLARNVFHLRGISWDGQVGYDIARLCREVFGGPLAAQDFANAFFGNDATPGFVLTTEQQLSDIAIARLRASHNNRNRGVRNAHKFDVYEEGVKPARIGANAAETQLVDVGHYHVEQVARVFGVPLTKIGHMIHSGNRANMEEDDRASYKQCLRPWSRKIECEADVKLFGRINRGRLFTLHDFSVLLKGNSEQMTNQACQLLDRGVLDIDEARDMFDLNPIGGEEGKTRPYPRNFTILEKAGEDPPNPTSGGAGGDSPGAGRSNSPPGSARAEVMPAQVQATFGNLLSDAYARLLRVESDKAHRASNKELLGSHIVGYYNPEGEKHIADTIRPVLAAALLAMGQPADKAESCAAQCAEDHATRSIKELAEGTWAKEWANGRANEQAQKHLQTLWESIRGA